MYLLSDNVELGENTHSPQGYQQVRYHAPECHDYSSGNCVNQTTTSCQFGSKHLTSIVCEDKGGVVIKSVSKWYKEYPNKMM